MNLIVFDSFVRLDLLRDSFHLMFHCKNHCTFYDIDLMSCVCVFFFCLCTGLRSELTLYFLEAPPCVMDFFFTFAFFRRRRRLSFVSIHKRND